MENQIDTKKPIVRSRLSLTHLSSLEKLAFITYSVVKCLVIENYFSFACRRIFKP